MILEVMMNKYGALAERYSRENRPVAYGEISDPGRFFTDLGERVAAKVDSLAGTLAGPDLPGEGYLEKVGRLNVARIQSEEAVLADMVYLPPEYDETDDPDYMETDEELRQKASAGSGVAEYLLMIRQEQREMLEEQGIGLPDHSTRGESVS